jgi:hypothetical protein
MREDPVPSSTPEPDPESSRDGTNGTGPDWELDPEVIPDLDALITEDSKPVENSFIEKQQRVLTEPLYSSWPGPEPGRPFLVQANVGLFYAMAQPPLVPDVLLALDVARQADLRRKENRSYFVWLVGKVPEVVLEIVSDRRRGEATHKMRDYARLRILYYVIYDPSNILAEGVLRAFVLQIDHYEPIDPRWLSAVGLGLILWSGSYEDANEQWLRWCDQQGQVIPTGRERAEQEHQRAEQALQQAERLRAQLRAAGIEPTP